MGAGEGTRMWPLSAVTNKHLLKLGGKPVIRIIEEKLVSVPEITDISIICLEKDEKDYKWEFRDADIHLHIIDYNTGTAHEFYNALLDLVTINKQEFFLHYGDTITDLDYSKLMTAWEDYSHNKAMIAVTQNIRHDYSQVYVDSRTNQVIEVEEKPKLLKPSWTGIGVFNAEYFMEIYQNTDTPKEGSPYLDIAYHILPAMVKDGGLYAYEYNGRWFDVGNLRSYQKLYAEYQNKDLNL
jgi:NDP-sugar pyrophosphorylase family protein